MKKIYLDYAASTPLDYRVKAAMEPFFADTLGNAGSLHSFGQAASAAIFKARQTIAKTIGANYNEIIFTGSATEANNLALRGVIKAFSVERLALSKNLRTKTLNAIPHNPRIIVSSFEHVSISETCRDLEKSGVEVIYIPVSRGGFIDFKKLKAALNERTVLVSVMYVNNEVGTIQPISEISEAIRAFRRNNNRTLNPKRYMPYPLFHTDAVQALQYLDCNVDKLGVDLMTLSAHKIYGPKGIGALYVKNSENEKSRNLETRKSSKSQFPVSYFLSPIITGGGQEPGGLWSGTPNTPSIVGFGKAAEIAVKIREKEAKRAAALRDHCWRELKKAVPKAVLNGGEKNRIPNNLNVYFPGRSAYDLVMKIDLRGAAVSAGVACSARMTKPSAVLKAMGLSDEQATGSLRITLGRPTFKKDIDSFIKTIQKVLR